MGHLTKEDVLREIPCYMRKGERIVRPDFRALHRVVSSQILTQSDLVIIRDEIVARRKHLGFDDEGS